MRCSSRPGTRRLWRRRCGGCSAIRRWPRSWRAPRSRPRRTTRGTRRAERLERLFAEVRRRVISPSLLSLVRCPDCHGALAGDRRTRWCAGHADARITPRRATISICARSSSSPSRRSTWTSRSTPTRATNASRRRCSARRSATTCCAPSSPPTGTTASSIWAAAAAARCSGTATGRVRRSASTSARSSRPRRGAHVDLLLGDLRQLPFADGTFTKAFSLDVLEHLSPEALRGMLTEAARVLAPGGALFVYTHVRKNAPIAAGLRGINALARQLERLGLHRPAPGAAAQVGSPESASRHPGARARSPRDAGFRIEPHPLLHAARRRLRREHPDAHGRARDGAPRGAAGWPARSAPPRPTRRRIREARTAAKARIASSRGTTYAALRGLSFAMKLDLLLFGRVRSGPFFALLVKEPMMRILYCAIDQTVPGTHGRIRPRARRWRRDSRRSATTCTCWRRRAAAVSRRAGALDRDAAAARPRRSCAGRDAGAVRRIARDAAAGRRHRAVLQLRRRGDPGRRRGSARPRCSR